MNKKDKKAIFREKVFQKISKKRVNNYKIDKLINKNLLMYIKKNKMKNIMLYIPLKNEVNIFHLIKDLREKRYNLYVPFMEGKSFRLVQYRLPLKKKKFGIKEPKLSYKKVKNIDLAIVPVLGIDKSLRRVGFGKGMYDRFFEKNSKFIKEILFIQRELCYSNEIITNSYDIKADSIITNSIKVIEI